MFLDHETIELKIVNNVIPLLIEPPNSMRSDAGDLSLNKHPIILSMIEDDPCSTTSLKIKDEVFHLYGPNMCIKEKDVIWDRENTEVRDQCNIL